MARDSFQTGSVRARETKRQGTVWELRYRVRDASSGTGWRELTEKAPPECRTRRDALKLLSKKLTEVNARNSPASSSGSTRTVITFADFVKGEWQSYVERRKLKPSTLYSYRSMIDNYLLPAFGKRLLPEISPQDLTAFFERARGGKRTKYLINLCLMLRSRTRWLSGRQYARSYTGRSALMKERARRRRRSPRWVVLRLGGS